MGKNKSNIKRSQIVKYWENKYLSKNLDIIDHFEEGTIPIIKDLEVPHCWTCGCFNYKIFENKEIDSKLLKNNKVWDLNELSGFLQKAHIMPRQFGLYNLTGGFK